MPRLIKIMKKILFLLIPLLFVGCSLFPTDPTNQNENINQNINQGVEKKSENPNHSTHPLTPSLAKRRGIEVIPLFEERE